MHSGEAWAKREGVLGIRCETYGLAVGEHEYLHGFSQNTFRHERHDIAKALSWLWNRKHDKKMKGKT